MASLKTAMKSHQKSHRERGQLSGRKHLGLLEKRKDYLSRAKDFHRKESTIKKLKKKALEKNPDEFYFQMVNNKTKDGVHVKRRDQKVYTKDQINLMKTQDMNYINLQKNTESKRIEKLQSNLHFLDEADAHKGSHTFFVDTKKEEKQFDAAAQLDTLPELLSNTHNIPTINMLRSSNFTCNNQERILKLKKKSYTELESRLKRDMELNTTRQGMILQRQLMGKGTVRKRKEGAKASYKWKKIRKR